MAPSVLFFWFTCYSVGLISLLFTASLLVLKHRKDFWAQFVLLFSFSFLVVSLTGLNYAKTMGSDILFSNLTKMFSYLSIGMLATALVYFSNELIQMKDRHKLIFYTIGIHGVFTMGAMFSVLTNRLRWMQVVILSFMGFSILYAALGSYLSRETKQVFLPDWMRKILLWLLVLCLPGFIIVDLFHGVIPYIRNNIPNGFYFVPLFYLCWSIMNIINIWPEMMKRIMGDRLL